ncbi:hypothetical protein DFP72DRAFT_421192 [Ephemerocybe angulata]|uniref:Uncharacterized protein n=1 Tax=Ephemerocybe angulata TaxID=980116 RepID=A0A8H6IHF6_9AGAR|nr:hypothetical protein DFP72DRAFT_421192 [Tulosesus angulatus]
MDSDHSMGSAHPSPEPSTCSDKPTTPTGLDLAQEVASFMQALFRARCNDHAPEKLKLPAWMNQDLLEDCYLAVDVIYTASLLRNSCESPDRLVTVQPDAFLHDDLLATDETNWDIVKYMAAGPPSPGPYPAGTEPLFPNAFSQAGTKPVDLVDVPGHIKDSEGRIMAWYLPSIISKRRQAQVQNAIIRMVDERKKPLPIDTRFGTNWRTHPFWFQDAKETRVPGGCICYSPCWYEQGHTVSSCSQTRSIGHFGERYRNRPVSGRNPGNQCPRRGRLGDRSTFPVCSQHEGMEECVGLQGVGKEPCTDGRASRPVAISLHRDFAHCESRDANPSGSQGRQVSL